MRNNRLLLRGIGRHIALYILMFSSAVTLLSTALQLGLEYRRDINDIETLLLQIQHSYSESLAASLWSTSKNDIELQLKGILRLPDIVQAEVIDDTRQMVASAGSDPGGDTIRREFPLYFEHRGEQMLIGQVRTVASVEGVYRRLRQKIVVILITQTVKTFLVSLFILFLFQLLVGRHLKKIAAYADAVIAERPAGRLQLERSHLHGDDELDQVVSALNAMQRRLQESFVGLQQSEFRWKFALEGAGDGVWDWDVAQQHITFSRRWKEMLGYAEQEIGDTFAEWESRVHADDLPRALAGVQAHVAGATPAYVNEFRMRRKDGSWCWVLARGMVVRRDASGAALRMIGTHCDVTERRQAEEAVRELNEKLESKVEERTAELRQAMEQIIEAQKLASLGRMVVGMSHELNTPIGNIMLMASTLQDMQGELATAAEAGKLSRSGLQNTLARCLQASGIILSGARRVSGLVDSFKRLSADQGSQARQRFWLLPAIQDMVAPLSQLVELDKIRIELQIPANIGMDSYPGYLEQIVSNLVMNSARHAFEGRPQGLIRISAAAMADGWIELVYSDDGQGIPQEVLHRVFEPFYTTKLGQGGAGLGLSIVHNLTQAVFKGRLQLYSEPGKGVRFTFALPAVTPELDPGA